MSEATIVLGRLWGREAAARIVDGDLDDLLVAPGGDVSLPGAIFRAVAERPLKGQGGAILRLPRGHAYLRGAKSLAPGRAVTVQVTGFAEPRKAVPVTTRLSLRSRYAVATLAAPGLNVSREVRDDEARVALHDIAETAGRGLPTDCGLIVRSLAAAAEDAAIAEDIATLVARAQAIAGASGNAPEMLEEGPGPHRAAWIDWGFADTLAEGDDAFAAHEVEDMVDAVLAPEQALPGGGNIVIEPTRALIAVDVNTGADHSPASGLKANLAAAAALPRLLRLRGLGGQIVIDAAPQSKGDRARVDAALAKSFRADPVATTLAGWTPLGHIELQRRRLRPTLKRPVP